jgi:spore germination protein GerM
MKKFLGYTTIFVLLGILFFSFSNVFVEQEKEVVVEKDIEQTTLANIYLVELDKQNNQQVIPVKRKILKDKIFSNTINALLQGPNENERNKGLSTEIPAKTTLINIGEYEDIVVINLSPNFESGGGSDSLMVRFEQLANTVSDMTEKPVYLYINGKEINMLGGDGLMIKQPINIAK